MTTISGTSSAGSAWSDTGTQRSGRHHGGMDAAKLFAKVDADGSGSVDSSELQTVLDKMAERSGQAGTTTAVDAMTKMDSNGDGSLDKDELAAGMKSLMPPPSSTMDFAHMALSQAASGGGSGSQDTADRKSGFDIDAFANMVMRQYAGVSNADTATQGQSISVTA